MKILVLGDIRGKCLYINDYLYKTNADIALCTGNMLLHNHTANNSDFPIFLQNQERFIKPVYSVTGPNDNYSVVDGLRKKRNPQVHNFTVMENGAVIEVDNNTADNIPLSKIRIGGIGGSFAPQVYHNEELKGSHRRHFTQKEVHALSNSGEVHIVVLHDLPENIGKTTIEFSNDTYDLLEKTNAMYCFVGHYGWFRHAKLGGCNLIVMPYAHEGCMVIDTAKDWDAEYIANIKNVRNISGK